ncbi:hypothetical protein [Paenibacillus sabinae]|uniref:hypothetical protein n=1 Tax=Paenibacillus sabinae TaxID=365617 RepID=UPI000A6FAFFD|nr:hypothetical protein [Paenibacillus sabinae]
MMPNRLKFLELAKIANARGTLTQTLKRVYLLNYVREVRKEQATTAMAARERLFENY